MDNSIKIVRGFTQDGMFYIFVFQNNRTEFRCQDIAVWISHEEANEMKEYISSLTFDEISAIIKSLTD